MIQKDFNEVIIRQTDRCKSILTAKGEEYAPRAVKSSGIDRLAHFKKAAVVMNSTPKVALMGMLSKHLISVSDMCTDDRVYPKEQWDEKITDMGTGQEKEYLKQCSSSMKNYEELVKAGVDNDSAGYCAPQGMRNILLISATPYQWKHMIRQRVCRRNTKETRYVMLKIWEQLISQNGELFSDCGPFCMNGGCEEGKMTCGKCIPPKMSPSDIIRVDFPKLCEETIWEEGEAGEDLTD